MSVLSKQKRRILGIIRAFHEMHNCVSEMDFRLSFLRLMEKIVVMTEEVEAYIEKASHSLLMEVDKDFSYKDMAKKLLDLRIASDKSLRLPLSDRNAPTLENETVMNTDYLKTTVDRFVPSGEDDKNMEDFNDENYIDALSKVGVHNLIPVNNIPLFLKKALNGLCDKMNQLNRILQKGNNTFCEPLYDSLFSPLNLSPYAESIRDEFDEWREKHDAYEGDAKWKQKLKEHIQDCMIELFNTGFLDSYEITMTEDEKVKCSESLKRMNKLRDEHLNDYICLCEMVEISFNKKDEISYKLNKKKIGRHIYQQRKNIKVDKTNFAHFLIRLQLHKDALEDKKASKQLDYNAPRIVFMNLLTSSKWIDKVLQEGYNTNYLENFVDSLMKSKHKDYIASGWCKKSSQEKMKGHLLGALSGAGVLISNASEIARHYTGKKTNDTKTSNFASYITEGKKQKNCAYSDWVVEYVKGEV